MKYSTLALFLFAASASATQDVDDPAQALQMLRLFLSDPKFSADVAAYSEAGCRWESEIIWMGGDYKNDKGVWVYGGDFSIVYKSLSSK